MSNRGKLMFCQDTVARLGIKSSGFQPLVYCDTA
jgi:hypothetical protein